MYRNSQILKESGDYTIATYDEQNYSMKICLNSNFAEVFNDIPAPYIKVYVNTRGSADSIKSKMCRISLLEPRYLGYEYEDLVFSNHDKSVFLKLLTDNNFKVWKDIIFHLNFDFRYDKIDPNYNLPQYYKLFTVNDVYNRKADYITENILKYQYIRYNNLMKLYSMDLKFYKNDIVHIGKYIYTLDTDMNKFRVYDPNDNKIAYRLYDIKNESFVANEFYSDENDDIVKFQMQYMSEPCNLYLPYLDFIFSIYEIIVLLISSRNNLEFHQLIKDI